MASTADSSLMTVFELPQLHNKPSASTILSTLRQLIIVPSSFNGEPLKAPLNIDENGLTAYLTRFIASPLTWIASDTEKEVIWEAASQRLSERSGRMAMASISRTFTICDFAVQQNGRAPRYLHINLNEPSLSEDNIGHKTWSGSFLLAKRLAHTMTKHIPRLGPSSRAPLESFDTTATVHIDAGSPETSPSITSGSALPLATKDLSTKQSMAIQPSPKLRILELGAGTGLAGIAAAALFPNVAVHLTDLPNIVPNLIANIQLNSHLFLAPPTAAALDWSAVLARIDPDDQFDCILAADSLYDPRHPDWLTNAIAVFLKRQNSARVIVELPFRDMDLPYHDLLRQEMKRKGFVVLEEGEEMGWDDWEASWSEKMAVRCWWSVWTWADEQLMTDGHGGKT